MNDKTKLVLKGYLDLNQTERAAFLESIGVTDNRLELTEKAYERAIKANPGGPSIVSSGGLCPCCGR